MKNIIIIIIQRKKMVGSQSAFSTQLCNTCSTCALSQVLIVDIIINIIKFVIIMGIIVGANCVLFFQGAFELHCQVKIHIC